MTFEENCAKIRELLEVSPRGYFNRIRNSYPDLLAAIITATQFLPSNSPLSVRIWHYLHKSTSAVIKCHGCDKEIKVCIKLSYMDRDFFYCNSCVQKLESTQAKSRQTKFEKHGDPYFNNHEKCVQTCLDKYGVTNSFNSEESIKKAKAKKLALHGDENWNNPDKARETNKKKAKENPDYWKERSEKAKATKVANGHDPNWCNSEKAMATCKKKYNAPCNAQTDKANAARKKKFIEMCGQEDLFSSEYFAKELKPKGAITQRRTFYRTRLCADTQDVQPLFSEDEYATTDLRDGPMKWHCKKCGTDFEDVLSFNNASYYGEFARCPNCYKALGGESRPELELFEYFKALCPDAVRKGRKIIPPYEVDMKSEAKKLAIEFDGLYYHSTFSGKPKDYHKMKTDMCISNGWRLIHVFEDEWLEKKDIVKSRIASICGVYDKKIYARDCVLRHVEGYESIPFQDANHLQGSTYSEASYGLYFGRELVALMCFTPCKTNEYEWEMTRFCCKLGYQVIGAASKLLKGFEVEIRPKSIVTYSDNRWPTHKLYDVLGFKLDHMTDPDFWYVKNQSRLNKSELACNPEDLPRYLPANGSTADVKDKYLVIYDCGQTIYVKNYDYSIS